MSYHLRFVQTFEPSAAQRFFELEAPIPSVGALLATVSARPRRSQMLAEGQPTNALIWEGDFSPLQDVEDPLKKLADDPAHTALFEKRQPLVVEV